MRTSARLAAADRDAVIKSERNAQTIVARTEIGSARGNTNGDLLHSYAADTRPLIRRRERDRGSVATPRFPATHPLRHTYFEISRWSTDTKRLRDGLIHACSAIFKRRVQTRTGFALLR